MYLLILLSTIGLLFIHNWLHKVINLYFKDVFIAIDELDTNNLTEKGISREFFYTDAVMEYP